MRSHLCTENRDEATKGTPTVEEIRPRSRAQVPEVDNSLLSRCTALGLRIGYAVPSVASAAPQAF